MSIIASFQLDESVWALSFSDQADLEEFLTELHWVQPTAKLIHVIGANIQVVKQSVAAALQAEEEAFLAFAQEATDQYFEALALSYENDPDEDGLPF